MPTLKETARSDIDADFTLEEIISSIKSFPSGKVTGTDGFGCRFYEMLSGILATLLLRMISISTEKKPKTLYESNISVILKKRREATDPANYRHIALQNFDRKIIAKILANWLNKHRSSIIHPDQTGFIPDRFTFSNPSLMQSMPIMLGSAKQQFCPLMHIKPLIRWRYMLESLRRFGETFISL